MKRLLFLVLIMLFATGCSADSELEEFTETFNQRADSEGVAILIAKEFGEFEEYEGEKWRVLYESDKYEIIADYDGKNIIGYSMYVSPDEVLKGKESEGYEASTLVARTLGLNVGEYSKNYEKATRADFHNYEDGEYKTSFVNIGWDSTAKTSMSIHFEKSN